VAFPHESVLIGVDETGARHAVSQLTSRRHPNAGLSLPEGFLPRSRSTIAASPASVRLRPGNDLPEQRAEVIQADRAQKLAIQTLVCCWINMNCTTRKMPRVMLHRRTRLGPRTRDAFLGHGQQRSEAAQRGGPFMAFRAERQAVMTRGPGASTASSSLRIEDPSAGCRISDRP
jgi:hypothetical protein